MANSNEPWTHIDGPWAYYDSGKPHSAYPSWIYNKFQAQKLVDPTRDWKTKYYTDRGFEHNFARSKSMEKDGRYFTGRWKGEADDDYPDGLRDHYEILDFDQYNRDIQYATALDKRHGKRTFSTLQDILDAEDVMFGNWKAEPAVDEIIEEEEDDSDKPELLDTTIIDAENPLVGGVDMPGAGGVETFTFTQDELDDYVLSGETENYAFGTRQPRTAAPYTGTQTFSQNALDEHIAKNYPESTREPITKADLYAGLNKTGEVTTTVDPYAGIQDEIESSISSYLENWDRGNVQSNINPVVQGVRTAKKKNQTSWDTFGRGSSTAGSLINKAVHI
tara:strand:+ start:252 stop:1253 length:1002 start_codon:yes stop_codon:yes gene_type:complete